MTKHLTRNNSGEEGFILTCSLGFPISLQQPCGQWRGAVAGGLGRVDKGVKHVMTRVTAADPVSPVITVGCMWTQGFQDETTGQPCQTRGQLRGIESDHSGTPGVPLLNRPLV